MQFRQQFPTLTGGAVSSLGDPTFASKGGYGGGGGGGYSGGNGGDANADAGGGGGSYYDSGITNEFDMTGSSGNLGNGQVTITELTATPEPGSFTLIALASAVLFLVKRRRAV